MYSDSLYLEPVSSSSWVAYGVPVISILAIFPKPEAVVC